MADVVATNSHNVYFSEVGDAGFVAGQNRPLYMLTPSTGEVKKLSCPIVAFCTTTVYP